MMEFLQAGISRVLLVLPYQALRKQEERVFSQVAPQSFSEAYWHVA